LTLEADLRALLGAEAVLPGDARGYDSDQTEGMGVRARPAAVALPSTADEVTSVVRWCYEHDVAIVPRGGGTGFAGGAVAVGGGVVVSLERMTAVRAFEPLLWRMQVEAGVSTATVRRLARENGLFFPPDPGAAEQSQIGGNIATNAGGPHAFKYGVTGAWVTGLEVVLAPGELVRVGGPVRKDVTGYDLKNLLIGSEGTLGVITAAWLRLLPAPEAALPVVAFYESPHAGCAAIEAVLGSGLVPAALEFFDAGTLAATAGAFPGELPARTEFAVIAEADGSAAEAEQLQGELRGALGGTSIEVSAEELWRWRDGVSIAVTARRGGKVSEDIVVPVDRLEEAITETVAIGRSHELEACSWGHAGDGNLHSTFMVDARDRNQLERAEQAAQELFALAVRLGGSVSGEHGLGWAKRGQLERQWPPRALELHEQVKRVFDPKGLLNPGKKLARYRPDGHPPHGGLHA
jgi:glycolate dehydrogenase FAD-linked subunit